MGSPGTPSRSQTSLAWSTALLRTASTARSWSPPSWGPVVAPKTCCDRGREGVCDTRCRVGGRAKSSAFASLVTCSASRMERWTLVPSGKATDLRSAPSGEGSPSWSMNVDQAGSARLRMLTVSWYSGSAARSGEREQEARRMSERVPLRVGGTAREEMRGEGIAGMCKETKRCRSCPHPGTTTLHCLKSPANTMLAPPKGLSRPWISLRRASTARSSDAWVIPISSQMMSLAARRRVACSEPMSSPHAMWLAFRSPGSVIGTCTRDGGTEHGDNARHLDSANRWRPGPLPHPEHAVRRPASGVVDGGDASASAYGDDVSLAPEPIGEETENKGLPPASRSIEKCLKGAAAADRAQSCVEKAALLRVEPHALCGIGGVPALSRRVVSVLALPDPVRVRSPPPAPGGGVEPMVAGVSASDGNPGTDEPHEALANGFRYNVAVKHVHVGAPVGSERALKLMEQGGGVRAIEDECHGQVPQVIGGGGPVLDGLAEALDVLVVVLDEPRGDARLPGCAVVTYEVLMGASGKMLKQLAVEVHVAGRGPALCESDDAELLPLQSGDDNVAEGVHCRGAATGRGGPGRNAAGGVHHDPVEVLLVAELLVLQGPREVLLEAVARQGRLRQGGPLCCSGAWRDVHRALPRRMYRQGDDGHGPREEVEREYPPYRLRGGHVAELDVLLAIVLLHPARCGTGGDRRSGCALPRHYTHGVPRKAMDPRQARAHGAHPPCSTSTFLALTFSSPTSGLKRYLNR